MVILIQGVQKSSEWKSFTMIINHDEVDGPLIWPFTLLSPSPSPHPPQLDASCTLTKKSKNSSL